MPIFVPTQGQGALLPLRAPQVPQQQFQPLDTLGAASLIQRKQQMAQQDILLALRKQQMDFQEQLALAQNEQEFFKSINQNHMVGTAQSQAQKSARMANSYGLDPRFYAPAIQEFDSQIADAMERGMKAVSNATNLRDQRQAQADLRSLMSENYRKVSQNEQYRNYLINQQRFDDLNLRIAEATSQGLTVNYAKKLELENKMRANGENKAILTNNDFNPSNYIFDQKRVNTLIPTVVTEALNSSKQARAGKAGETYPGMATTIEEEVERSYDDAYELAYNKLVNDPDVRAYAENLNMMPGAQPMSVEDRITELVTNELRLKKNQDDVTLTAIHHQNLPGATVRSSSTGVGGGTSETMSPYERLTGRAPSDGDERAMERIMLNEEYGGWDSTSSENRIGDIERLAEYEGETFEKYFKGDKEVDNPKDADRKVIYDDTYNEETGEGTVLASFKRKPATPTAKGAKINVTGDTIQDVDQAFSAVESGGWTNPYEAKNNLSTALGRRQFLYTDFREPITEQLDDLGIDWQKIDLNDLSESEKNYFRDNKVWSSAERRKANGLTDDDKKKAVAFLRSPRAQDNLWEDHVQDNLLPDLPTLRRLDPGGKYSDLQLMYIRHHEGGLQQAAHFLNTGESSHKETGRNITGELNKALGNMGDIQTRSGITGNFDENGFLSTPKQSGNFMNFLNRDKGSTEQSGLDKSLRGLDERIRLLDEESSSDQPPTNDGASTTPLSDTAKGVAAASILASPTGTALGSLLGLSGRGNRDDSSQLETGSVQRKINELQEKRDELVRNNIFGDDISNKLEKIDRDIKRFQRSQRDIDELGAQSEKRREATRIKGLVGEHEQTMKDIEKTREDIKKEKIIDIAADDVLSRLVGSKSVKVNEFNTLSAGEDIVIDKSQTPPYKYRIKVNGKVIRVFDNENELKEYLTGFPVSDKYDKMKKGISVSDEEVYNRLGL